MKIKFHQPGETKRDTGIYDMKDHRTLELGIRAMVKIRTFVTSLAQRKGRGQKGWRKEEQFVCVQVSGDEQTDER